MSPNKTQMISEEDAALQARLRLIGTIVLIAGLAGSLLAYVTTAPADEAAQEESKRYLYEMEYIGGKGNLLATEIRLWFIGLWHGRGLAHMLAFVAIAGSTACFFLAGRLGRRGPANGSRGDKSA